MTASTDTYHVHIEHHAAMPAALAEAQRALLDQQAARADRRAGRVWGHRAVVALGILVASGLVLLLVASPSVGRASAYERCVADAQGIAQQLSAAALDGEVVPGQGSVEDLCSAYRS